MAVSDLLTRTLKYASDAEQAEATDPGVAVSPANQQSHPSACKGWVKFNMSDDTIDDSYNVSSLAHSAIGATTINWDVDFANANHSNQCSPNTGTAGPGNMDTKTTSSSRVLSYNAGATLIDALVSAFAYGDQ